MKSMSKQEMYKHKADKYYLRYKICKQIQKGGTPTKIIWIDAFLNELSQVYEPEFVITGLGAIVLYLNYYNEKSNGKFNNLISMIQTPNNIDFLYCCKETKFEQRKSIKNFIRKQDSPQRSVTYNFNNSTGITPNYIKSFDLTCLLKIDYSKINTYKVLSLEKLLHFYSNKLADKITMVTLLRNRKTELEAKLEAKKDTDINEYSDLTSEHYELSAKLEKKNNKISSLQGKIDIINILHTDITQDYELKLLYKLEYITIIETNVEQKYHSFSDFNTGIIDRLEENKGLSLRTLKLADLSQDESVASPASVSSKILSPSLSSSTSILGTPGTKISKSSDSNILIIPYDIKFNSEL
jgi:hypothetical protein